MIDALLTYTRHIEPFLESALKRSPVVLVNGSRQCGKTSLVLKMTRGKEYSYINFDDELTYLAAKSSPQDFISDLEKPTIIDEVQRIPELFLAIKRDVDNNRVPGRYLLTCSANPLLIKKVGDSLAGRMEVFDLMPLSQGEIEGHKEEFIDNVFNNPYLKSPQLMMSKKELYKRIFAGGYPLMQNKSEEDQEAWMRSYLNLILSKDIKDLAKITKLMMVPRLLKILSSRASGLLNVAQLSRDSKISVRTLHRYLVLLETIFLINLILPWSSNRSISFIKSPKLYLIDSGLLSYLLDITLDRALKDSTWMGKILENFVVNELKKQITWSKEKPDLYHFRTLGDQEVDIILENRSGEIVAIEVKNSSKVVQEDFKGIRYLKEKLRGKLIKGIVLYIGEKTVPFGDDLFAIPIHALWD